MLASIRSTKTGDISGMALYGQLFIAQEKYFICKTLCCGIMVYEKICFILNSSACPVFDSQLQKW
ncbi:MAG: sortase B protein-sorting domain-containing protein [Prevotella sp.]|nr:sortase B protein-sorting domain-containing protein [Prevotella sp.]